MNNPRRRTLVILIALQAAFMCRVAGQMAVAAGIAPWLPTFERWQSGLLPYPLLVVAQLAIIALQSKIATDIARDRGFFAQHNRRLARVLTICGVMYFGAMIIRYFVGLAALPIPIFFHLVLATYVLTVASYLRCASPKVAEKYVHQISTTGKAVRQ